MLVIRGTCIGPQPAVFSEALSNHHALQRRLASLTLGTILGGAGAPAIATALFDATGTSRLITVTSPRCRRCPGWHAGIERDVAREPAFAVAEPNGNGSSGALEPKVGQFGQTTRRVDLAVT